MLSLVLKKSGMFGNTIEIEIILPHQEHIEILRKSYI